MCVISLTGSAISCLSMPSFLASLTPSFLSFHTYSLKRQTLGECLPSLLSTAELSVTQGWCGSRAVPAESVRAPVCASVTYLSKTFQNLLLNQHKLKAVQQFYKLNYLFILLLRSSNDSEGGIFWFVCLYACLCLFIYLYMFFVHHCNGEIKLN